MTTTRNILFAATAATALAWAAFAQNDDAEAPAPDLAEASVEAANDTEVDGAVDEDGGGDEDAEISAPVGPAGEETPGDDAALTDEEPSGDSANVETPEEPAVEETAEVEDTETPDTTDIENDAELSSFTNDAEILDPDLLDVIEPLEEVDDATFSPDEAVERASAYLNDLDTLRARFMQIGPDGSVAEGDLYIKRPGRARFEYDEPHPSLIVSDGATVAHQDRELDTIDRVPIRATPLHLFLRRNVDLARDSDIARVDNRPGELSITVRDRDGDVDGELTLIFATPQLELREWVVLDGLGQQTTIVLREAVRGGELAEELFALRDDGSPRRRRRGGR